MVVSETTPPLHVRKERQKKEAGCSRLVGSKFNKQGNVHTGARRGQPQESRSLHPSAKMLNIYIDTEALMCSVMYPVQMVSTTHCSL